jgi:integrase
MSRPKGLPSYRLHKASGQARAIVRGRHIYLGPYGSPESHERFARLIAEYVQVGGAPGAAQAEVGTTRAALTINELILAYWEFAKSYYVSNGSPTTELTSVRYALQPLRQLFGNTLANDFGPKSLGTVRRHMITVLKLARTEINKRIGKIKRIFKWGVAEELVDPSVYHGLQALAGLRYGRTDAHETEPVKPVADADVDAVLAFLTPQIRAMVEVQRLTGMRPGEVVLIRSCDIDRSGDVWVYEPFTHKNRWRGHRRQIPLGPKAQDILSRFLDRDADAFLFSPKESEAWRVQQRAAMAGQNRATRIFPCEIRNRELRKRNRQKRSRRRPIRERYDVDSYRRAIEYGIQRARKASVEIQDWHPAQLRHAKATELRKQHGLEAAQVVLGHARADVTQIYAEKNIALAKEIAKQFG